MPRGQRFRRAALLVALALCTTPEARAADEVPLTPTLEDVARFERQRDKRPNRAEHRDALGLAYYRYARAALERKEFATYEDYLQRAMREWLASLKLDPENPSPHIFMGMVSAYQGRIEETLDSMYNARQLEPGAGIHYTNIAETLIYAGRPQREIETWLERAERMAAPPAVVELNFCLLRWREGDAASAARRFATAKRLDPSVVRVWNEAPVTRPIQTFGDLADYCCGTPACGPYLKEACATSQLEVVKRELPAEVARRELVIEMERRRELERIYRQRRDLEIRVQDPNAAASTAESGAAQATPPGESAEREKSAP
jgi:tetratricopeptide (TPR) repeat protein